MSRTLQNSRNNKEKLIFKQKNYGLSAVISFGTYRLRTVNRVRTIFERQNEYIYIPDLRSMMV